METKRINMILPQTEADEIKSFADDDAVSATEIIRRSFKLYKFIRNEIKAGRRIVTSDKDGKNPVELMVLI
jgi:hypothetical protein